MMIGLKLSGIVVLAYLCAGYIGYIIGVERGIEMCRTHRRRRRNDL